MKDFRDICKTRHPNIKLLFETDYLTLRNQIRPAYATVYSGPVDEYFDYKLGKLPWRSVHSEFVYYDKEFHLPCMQVNHPNEHEYTREIEIKHVTRQKHPGTVVAYEYPRGGGEPYYPIPNIETNALYSSYRELADLETRNNQVYFCGRLARYCYINSDQAMEMALETFEQIRKDFLLADGSRQAEGS